MRPIKEIRANERVFNIVEGMSNKNLISGFVKLPDCGICSFICSDDEDGIEHVSVTPRHKFKIPSWDDMCVLKDICWYPEEEAYQIMPKKSEYVNIMQNCLHLWKPIGKQLSDLVEVKQWK